MAKYKIAFDVKLGRPGCVLIQAALGTVPNKLFNDHFPVETWLTGGSDNMKVYEVNEDELAFIGAKAKTAVKGSR
jgi:hypothetical protein